MEYDPLKFEKEMYKEMRNFTLTFYKGEFFLKYTNRIHQQ